MKKILIVHSSVRENRVSDQILSTFQAELKVHGDYEISVADFKTMPLPFFDSAISPASEDFVATDANVVRWTKMVEDADAVVMLVAEYNGSFTAVLKNAIDWMVKPWNSKPIALIGYGWAGGELALAQLRGVLGSKINAMPMETAANLRFMKDIAVDGSVIDQEATHASINVVLEELATVL